MDDQITLSPGCFGGAVFGLRISYGTNVNPRNRIESGLKNVVDALPCSLDLGPYAGWLYRGDADDPLFRGRASVRARPWRALIMVAQGLRARVVVDGSLARIVPRVAQAPADLGAIDRELREVPLGWDSTSDEIALMHVTRQQRDFLVEEGDPTKIQRALAQLGAR